ncbi:MAG: CPXCG motif-containing cysteine-rich protein [candidate division FCPU426 bacterium]
MDVSETVTCPYCGEPNEISIDPSAGSRQAYVEDCQVCCRPWHVRIHIARDGEAQVSLQTEDEVGSDE